MNSFGLALIGRDAELRTTPEGTSVCNLSLAFTYGRKGGDGKRPTQWVDASLWGKQAEALAPYLVKGGRVAVTLQEVHIERFDRRDGTQGEKLVGRVIDIQLAGSPREGSAPAPATAPAPARAPAPAARTAAPAPAFDDFEDDIPFASSSMHFDMEHGTERRMRRYHW